MSIIDIIKAIISIPVIVTLFTSRQPGPFENEIFCAIWTVLFYCLLRVSIFLVLLVSITRTMGMTFPVHKVRRNAVLLSLAIFTGFILCIDIAFLSTGLLEMRYRKNEAFSEMFEPKDLTFEDYKGYKAAKIYTILLKMEVILPTILVFISFIVGTVLLFRQMENRRKMKKDETELRYASVTVAMFTALFLLCNLPCFCLQLIYFLSQYCDMSFIRGNVVHLINDKL